MYSGSVRHVKQNIQHTSCKSAALSVEYNYCICVYTVNGSYAIASLSVLSNKHNNYDIIEF